MGMSKALCGAQSHVGTTFGVFPPPGGQMGVETRLPPALRPKEIAMPKSKVHAMHITPRRQYLKAWGRMLRELRRLDQDALTAVDPDLSEAISAYLAQGEALAVCMVVPGAYALTATH